MSEESTVVPVRFVVTPNAPPYASESDPRKALAKALDDFLLGDPKTGAVGRGMYWLVNSVLEAKVIPYEAD